MPLTITVNHPTWDAGSAVSDDVQKSDTAAMQSEYGADKSNVFNPTVEDYYSENDDHGYSEEPALDSFRHSTASQGSVAANRSHPLDRGRKKSSRAEGPINIGSTSSARERHRRETRERSPGSTESQTRHAPGNLDGHNLTALPQPPPRFKYTPERHEENDQDVRLAGLDGEKKKTGDTPEPAIDVLGNDSWGESSWGISAGKKKKGKRGKALEVGAGGSNEKEVKKIEDLWDSTIKKGKDQAASGFDFDFSAFSDPVQISTLANAENEGWVSFSHVSKAKKKSKKGVAEESQFPASSKVIPDSEPEPAPEPESEIVDNDCGFSPVWGGDKKKKGNTEPDLLNATPPPPPEPVSKLIRSKLESVPELSETPESVPEIVNPRRERPIITNNYSMSPEQYSISDEEDSSGVQVSSGSQEDDYTDSEEDEDEEWDYIEEIEPEDRRGHSPPRSRPLPRRYSSHTSRRPCSWTSTDDGYDDYPGYGPPSQPPLANSSAPMHKPSIGTK